MRLASFTAPAACGMLVLSLASNAAAQSGERRSGWYVGGGVGANWASEIEQNGFNRRSALLSDRRLLRRAPAARIPRLPLGLRSRFRGWRRVRAGGRIRPRPDTPWSCRSASAGTTSTRCSAASPPSTACSARGSAQQHRHVEHRVVDRQPHGAHPCIQRVLRLPERGDRVLALCRRGRRSRVRRRARRALLRRVLRHGRRRRAAHDPPLASYTASLDDDFSDTVLAGHLHAGADFGVNERTALGVKLTYSLLSEVEYTGTYDLHAAQRFDPDFSHTDTFTGARSWSLQFTIRYVLGG